MIFMVRGFSVILSLLILSLLLTPTLVTAEEYLYILGNRGNPYWVIVAQGITDAANEQGVNAKILHLASDIDGEGELNLCRSAIERQPRLLAIVAVNETVGVRCLQLAAERGILLGDVDATLPPDALKGTGLSLQFAVGSDNFEVGRKGAEFLAEDIKKRAPQIFVLEGPVGGTVARKRHEGFTSRFRELRPDAEIVGSIAADWDRLKAFQFTSDILERYPTLDAIFSANDTMALGAAEAVRARRKTVTVVGVDGIAEAREQIRQGKLRATVAQLPYLIGKRVVELAVHPEPGKREIVLTPVLTQESLSAGTDELLKYVR